MRVVVAFDFRDVVAVQRVQCFLSCLERGHRVVQDAVRLGFHGFNLIGLLVDLSLLILHDGLDVIRLDGVHFQFPYQLLLLDGFQFQDRLQFSEFGLQVNDDGIGISQFLKS
jgi:hypothetical protein